MGSIAVSRPGSPRWPTRSPNRPDLAIHQPRYSGRSVRAAGRVTGRSGILTTRRVVHLAGGPQIQPLPDPGDRRPSELDCLFPESVAFRREDTTRSTVEDCRCRGREALSSPVFFGRPFQHPWSSFPSNCIGHSRGASLVGQLPMIWPATGIWVDQVTTLDPASVRRCPRAALANYDFDERRWPAGTMWSSGITTGEPKEIHRRFLFDFTGETVSNTHDIQLVESVLEDGGDSSSTQTCTPGIMARSTRSTVRQPTMATTISPNDW